MILIYVPSILGTLSNDNENSGIRLFLMAVINGTVAGDLLY